MIGLKKIVSLLKEPQGGWFIKEEEQSLHLKTQEGLPSRVDAWAHARAPPEHTKTTTF